MLYYGTGVFWRSILNGLGGPGIPAHLRDDFTMLTAHHMIGQARLLFAGFLLSQCKATKTEERNPKQQTFHNLTAINSHSV